MDAIYQSKGGCSVESDTGCVEHVEQIEQTELKIDDEYIKNALTTSAQYLMESGKLIQPFNDMYAMQLFKQAELLFEQYEQFCKSINTNTPVISDDITKEIDDLFESLKDTIGEL